MKMCAVSVSVLAIVAFGSLTSCSSHDAALPPPNILWITSEDNSPFLGCYGDTLATTPNLDALAARGFLYTHAYANAPVCAPARNTIITGVYANSGGHQHMRSYYRKSDEIKLYPELLRAAGYYCTNNQKEDFNIDPDQTRDVWDELGKTAHYKHRKPGQPFFAIFNSTITHESALHQSIPTDKLRHKPEDVVLPPYHPDTEEFRHDWAQYYDKIEDMDAWVGKILEALRESGEAENTIVFFYGDHGGVLGRSKRFVYESGTRVPFIVYIPEKYKHLYPAERPGDRVDRIISFVDLVPTLLSIIEAPIPAYLQGGAFLGKQKSPDPQYAFMFRGRMDERYDMSRAVRDYKYRYIRNYMPHRKYAQYIEYLWRAPSMRSWEAAYKSGACNDVQSIFWNAKPVEELYDTENDPWEVHNLAGNPQYQAVLDRMRNANREWMIRIKDTGFIPEADMIERTASSSPYDYMHDENVDVEGLIDAAESSTTATIEDIPILVDYLASDDAAIRYWGATGLLLLSDEARTRAAIEALKNAANDSASTVAVVAGEALYRLGEKEAGREAFLTVLKDDNAFARTFALNAIECTGEDSAETRNAVIEMVRNLDEPDKKDYDWRCANGLLDKWKLDRVPLQVN